MIVSKILSGIPSRIESSRNPSSRHFTMNDGIALRNITPLRGQSAPNAGRREIGHAASGAPWIRRNGHARTKSRYGKGGIGVPRLSGPDSAQRALVRVAQSRRFLAGVDRQHTKAKQRDGGGGQAQFLFFLPSHTVGRQEQLCQISPAMKIGLKS
ncbi:MAG: hypothetical protein IPL03_17875 [Sterolibacteriaceae bacterium]|nr:hypothetical protein [Candidatus Methylophosphatis haderslevensis]